jgi:hypothetical protein
MSARTRELAERRVILRLRAAAQRRAIAQEFGRVEARLRFADRVLVLGRGVLWGPAVIGLGVLAAVLLGPRRSLRLLGRAVLLAGGLRGLFRAARNTL